jgi:hypothetical protein
MRARDQSYKVFKATINVIENMKSRKDASVSGLLMGK